MDGGSLSAVIYEDEPADRLSPLERRLDILGREMPAAFVPLSGTVRMDRTEPVGFLPQGMALGPEDTTLGWLDPIWIGDMIDRSYAGYQEVPLVATEPVDSGEVLIGKPLAAFSPEIPK